MNYSDAKIVKNQFVSRIGVMGEKIGMSTIFDGMESFAVTLIRIPNNYVLKKEDRDAYSVIRLGVADCKGKVNHPQKQEYKEILNKENLKNGFPIVKEFRLTKEECDSISDVMDVSMFENMKYVDVTSKSVGKGFQGCMKMWNFKGQGASHGASLSHRSIGSTGTRDFNWPGKKMPGRMGYETVTIQNLKIVKVDHELGVIAILGSVPGKKGTWVRVCKAIKKKDKVVV